MKKSTEELLQLLKKSNTIDDYFSVADESLISVSLSEELDRLIREHGKKPAEIFRRAGIDKSYGYDILSGKRSPSRDKVLAIMFGLEQSASDTQVLLKQCGYPVLYPKHTRDAVILFCLERRISLSDCNETLYDMGMELVE
ncbi:MAG: helix-turn-helix transcriptional regulator [Lachnospiraceae bacterium]|nr:helix-turn-helix transcriptional regulator [Lachnospiraceae bacterium]